MTDPHWTQRVSKICAIIVAFLCFGNFVRVAVLILSEPHILNFTEGISLHAANTLLAGQSLYQDINQPPFPYLAYPPGYAVLCSGLVKVFGNSLLPLRCFTVVCECVILALLFAILRKNEVPRFYALLTTAWLAGLLSVHKFHVLARVDMTTLALQFSVFYAVIRLVDLVQQEDKIRPSLVFWIAVGSVLAILVKTSAAFGLFWCGMFYLLCFKRHKRASLWALGALTVGGLLYGLVALGLNLATDGHFWENTVLFQKQSGLFPAWKRMGPFVLTGKLYFPLLVPALVAMLLKRRFSLVAWMSWVSLAWLFISSLKNGGDLNYNLPVLFWSTALLGLMLAKPTTARTVIPVVLLCSLLTYPVYRQFVWSHHTDPRWDLFVAESLKAPYSEHRQRLATFLADAEGPVISDEPYFATLHHKEVWMGDSFQLLLLWEKGIFHPQKVVESCMVGDITHVIAGPNLKSIEPFRLTLERFYIHVGGDVTIDRTTTFDMYFHRNFARTEKGKKVLEDFRP